MQRSNVARGREGRGESSPRQTPLAGALSRSASDALRQRSEESWVEISSQPSSSSLSSAATDEIVTTGLRVRQGALARRRRRLRDRGQSQRSLLARSSSAGSSQEEYEESESEDEQIMTSSNENVVHNLASLGGSPLLARPDESAYEEDDDENSTALGVAPDQPVFTPQPNAFSHPPSSQVSRQAVSDSYFPRQAGAASGQRSSYPSRRPPQHTPYNVISPSYQADHDAALRASLSTLLSCAAAARGLSKNAASGRGAGSTAAQPATFRIVPESVVDAEPAEMHTGVRKEQVRRASVGSSGSVETQDKGKRKATASPSKGSKERATKKTKRAFEETISPTLLTWVVSAGVVVIVSAIGFSAGYAMGKEVGRAEVGLANASEGGDCGKEAVRGLRRFRWGAAGASSVSVM
ncbi:MAG: hypothetical protein M1832_001336 [Thelocarpon impressellum]|nr:MAG: hypothetical protein M1832_001336 [Thelocarpon impressellum]